MNPISIFLDNNSSRFCSSSADFDGSSFDSSDDEISCRKSSNTGLRKQHPETAFSRTRTTTSRINNVCVANGFQQKKLLSFVDRTTDCVPFVSQGTDSNAGVSKFCDEVMQPLLIRFGWNYHREEDNYELQCDFSTIRVSSHTVFRRSESLQQVRVGYSMKDCSEDEEYLVSKFEEDLLFRRVEDSIDLQASVINSCVVVPPNVCGISDVNNPSTKKKEIKFVRGCKLMPKFVANGKEEILSSTIVRKAEEKVFEQLSQSLPYSERQRVLIACLKDCEGDPFSVILHAEGRSDLVDDLLKILSKRVIGLQAREKVQAVLTDKKSIEINVLIDITRDLGFKAIKPIWTRSKLVGVWIASIANVGQLKDIFGVATKQGAVLVKLSKKNVFKLADKNRLLAEAKSVYEGSGKDKDKWISMTVCLGRDASLRRLDPRKVIFAKDGFIRSRDGTVYRKFKRPITKRLQLNTKSLENIQKSLPPKSLTTRNKSTSLSYKRGVIHKSDKPKSSYFLFQEKVNEARNIEYRRAGIHAQTANRSMWNQHKSRYGEQCDMDCPCVSDMKYLSKNVVNDFMETQRQKDKSLSGFELKRDVFPVGFMSNFCDKFFNKVKESFPSDSPAQNLGRLVLMWKEHMKQRNFGLECRNECPCSEGWEVLFLPACFRCEDKSITTSNIKSLSRKRKIQIIDENEFQVLFNPSKETLGFFCATNKTGVGDICECVIMSFDPRGIARRRDNRIRRGTAIIASSVVSTLGSKTRIDSYTDLKCRYDALKRKNDSKTILKLYFRNSSSVTCRNESKHEKNWSESGTWLGEEKNGWAGGTIHGNKTTSYDDSHTFLAAKISSEDLNLPLPKKSRLQICFPADRKNATHVKKSRPPKNRIQAKLSGARNKIIITPSHQYPPKKCGAPGKKTSAESLTDQAQLKISAAKNENVKNPSFLKRSPLLSSLVLSSSKASSESSFNKKTQGLVLRSTSLPYVDRMHPFLNATSMKKGGVVILKDAYSHLKQRVDRKRPSILKKYSSENSDRKNSKIVRFADSVKDERQLCNIETAYAQLVTRKSHSSINSAMVNSNENSRLGHSGEFSLNAHASDYAWGKASFSDANIEANAIVLKGVNCETDKKCGKCQLVLNESSYSEMQKGMLSGICKGCEIEDLSIKRLQIESKSCGTCKLTFHEDNFSKRQWNQGTTRRCKTCIFKNKSFPEKSPIELCSFTEGDESHKRRGSNSFAPTKRDTTKSNLSPPTIEPTRDSNFVDHSGRIVNLALYKSLNEVKTFLEQEQPSGCQIAPALDSLKKTDPESSNALLKKKAIVLKIYSNIFYFLEKARDLKDSLTQSTITVEEYKETRKIILAELYEKARCIEQFQKRNSTDKSHAIIDGNISLTCGFSLLHASIILSDNIVASKIIKIGSDLNALCNKYGSPINLSRMLRLEAMSVEDRGVEGTQIKIFNELEQYLFTKAKN